MAGQDKVRVLDLNTIEKNSETYPEQSWFARVFAGREPVLLDVRLSVEAKVEALIFGWQDQAVVIRSNQSDPWVPTEVLRVLLATGDRLILVSHTDSREQAMMNAFGLCPGRDKKTLPLLVEQSGAMTGIPTESIGLPSILNFFACKQTPYDDDWLSIGEEVRCALGVVLRIVAPVEPGRPSQNIVLPDPEASGPPFEVGEALKQETVEARDDGLWCVSCQEGPIYGTKIMEMHVGTPDHRENVSSDTRRVERAGLGTIYREGIRVEVPKSWERRHIECALKDGDEGGWVWCKLCKTGHINDYAVIDDHIKKAKHMAKEREIVPSASSLLAQFSWNLPDYINVAAGQASCPWCSFKTGNFLGMRKHLESRVHQSTFEKHNPGRRPEYFSKEWGALLDGENRLIVREGGTTPHPPYDSLPLTWTTSKTSENPPNLPTEMGLGAPTSTSTSAQEATSAAPEQPAEARRELAAAAALARAAATGAEATNAATTTATTATAAATVVAAAVAAAAAAAATTAAAAEPATTDPAAPPAVIEPKTEPATQVAEQATATTEGANGAEGEAPTMAASTAVTTATATVTAAPVTAGAAPQGQDGPTSAAATAPTNPEASNLLLPPGWKTTIAPGTSNRYYYNKRLGRCQWDFPSAEAAEFARQSGGNNSGVTPESTPAPTPTPSVLGAYPPYMNGCSSVPETNPVHLTPNNPDGSGHQSPVASVKGEPPAANGAAKPASEEAASASMPQEVATTTESEPPAAAAAEAAASEALPSEASDLDTTKNAPASKDADLVGQRPIDAPPPEHPSHPLSQGEAVPKATMSASTEVATEQPLHAAPKQSGPHYDSAMSKAMPVPKPTSPIATKAPPPQTTQFPGSPSPSAAPNSVSSIATKAPPPQVPKPPSPGAASTVPDPTSIATKAPPPQMTRSYPQSPSALPNSISPITTKAPPPQMMKAPNPGVLGAPGAPGAPAPATSTFVTKAPFPGVPENSFPTATQPQPPFANHNLPSPQEVPCMFEAPSPTPAVQEDPVMTKAPPSTAPASTSPPVTTNQPTPPMLTPRGHTSAYHGSPASNVQAPRVSSHKDLPPGWKAVWDPVHNREYFADLQAQTSSWVLPSTASTTLQISPSIPLELCKFWAPGSWRREIDERNLAYWSCLTQPWKFYELGGEFRRLQDGDGRIYWSSQNGEVRFFESEK